MTGQREPDQWKDWAIGGAADSPLVGYQPSGGSETTGERVLDWIFRTGEYSPGPGVPVRWLLHKSIMAMLPVVVVALVVEWVM